MLAWLKRYIVYYEWWGKNVCVRYLFTKEDGMDMDNAWEKIKKSVREGAALSIEKIEEYSKIGKLKVEEFATKKKIERNYVDIGERVFELVESDKKADVTVDVAIKKSISNIRTLKEELVSIDKKIKGIIEEAKKNKQKNDESDDIHGI